MKSNYTNYTVIGELTYDDGVYGGFTGTDYLVLPQGIKNKSYTYITKFTTGSDVNTMQYVVHAEKFYSIEIAEGNIKCWSWDSGTGGNKTLFAASPNTTYWVKSTFAGNQRTYWHSTDGSTWTQDLQFSDNGTEVGPNKWQFRVGMESWNAIDPFQGTVDMNEFKVLSGNTVVWEPSTKTKLNANIVGSLTDLNGVTWGFSNSSYLTLPKTFPASSANTWELFVRFRHYDAGNVGQRVCGAINNTSLSQIVIGIDNNKLITWISSNGTDWNIASGAASATALTGGVLYDLRARFTGSQYLIDVKPEGGSWTNHVTVNSSIKMNQNNSVFMLGCAELTNYLRGSIYTKDCYININGKRWWSGLTYDNVVGSINISKGYYNDGSHDINMPDQRFQLQEVKAGQIIGNRNKAYAASLSGTPSLHLVGNDRTEQTLQGTYDVSAELSTPVYLSHAENYAISSEEDMSTISGLFKSDIELDVNNIGGVTIDSNGIASGFTSSKYLQVPRPFNPGTNDWEICFRLYFSPSVGYMWGSSTNYYQTVAGELQSGKKIGVGLSSNGTSWNIGWKSTSTAFTANGWIYIKIVFTGTQYIISSSTNGTTWTTESTTNNSTPIYQSSSSIIHLGTMGNKSSFFGGWIDLTQSYIKIAGQEFWRGAVVRQGIGSHKDAMYSNNETFWFPKDTKVNLSDLSNLSDVSTVYTRNSVGEDWSTLTLNDSGYPSDCAYIPEERAYLSHGTHDRVLGVQEEPNSLTATASNLAVTKVGSISSGTYGSVTGFSTSNYLEIPSFDPAGETWEVNLKIRTGADVTTNQKIFQSCLRKGQMGRYGLILNIHPSSKWSFSISSTGDSWLFDTTGSHTISTNTTYWVRFGWNGTAYYLDYSTDGTNYTRDITETHSEALYTPLTLTRLGIYSTLAETEGPFLGTMYLAHCYASIDGTEVWRGYKNGNLKLNCEAVGNPSFNPGGEAFNFSSTQYYTHTPSWNLSTASTWEIHTKVRLNSSGKYQFWYHDGPFAFGLDSSNRIHVWCGFGDFYSTQTFTELNVWYWFKLVFDGSSYKVYWKPAGDATYGEPIATLTNSTAVSRNPTFCIGLNPLYTAEYFYGTIDLSEMFVIIDGTEVWRAAETTFPDSGYRTTGSPTVSNYTASNFSTSNYLIPIMNFMPEVHRGPWEIGAKIRLKDIGVWNALFGGASGTYLPDLYINSSNHLAMNLSSTGNSYDITGGEGVVQGSYTFATNTDYWVRYGWTGSVYYAEYSTDGENYTRDISLNSTTALQDTWSSLFLGFRVGSYFHGSVYLLDTYMKTGNTEIWRGALYGGYGFLELSGGWTGLGNITYEPPVYAEVEKIPYNYSVDPEYNYNADLKGFLTVDYSNGKAVIRGLSTTADAVGTSTAAYLGYSYNVNDTKGKAIQNLTKTGTLCKAFRINAAGGSKFIFVRPYQIEDGKTFELDELKGAYSETNATPFRGLGPAHETFTYHIGEKDTLEDSQGNIYDEVGYVYVEWDG